MSAPAPKKKEVMNNYLPKMWAKRDSDLNKLYDEMGTAKVGNTPLAKKQEKKPAKAKIFSWLNR